MLTHSRIYSFFRKFEFSRSFLAFNRSRRNIEIGVNFVLTREKSGGFLNQIPPPLKLEIAGSASIFRKEIIALYL